MILMEFRQFFTFWLISSYSEENIDWNRDETLKKLVKNSQG